MSLVNRPLPALYGICTASAKTRAWWLCRDGNLPSTSRISCTEPSNGGSAMELEVMDRNEQTYHENSSASEDEDDDEEEAVEWSKDELDAISALFDRPMRQKPPKPPNPVRQRPLPLPLPHKTRLPNAPAPKQHIRLAARAALSSRSSFSDQVCKNPEVLIGIAREIAALPPESDVSIVLDRWVRFLRKGSLSMTIRELGHMGLPERALQTLCWAQRQTVVPLFPDDRILASTIEVLARFDQLKMEDALEQCVPSASRAVLEAMVSGFIRAGKVGLARKLLEFATINKRTLSPSVHVKLMLEAVRTPEGYGLAAALLDELGERPELHLRQQDCTAVMKVCVKLRRYAAVESLFGWFRDTGGRPTVVMYTAVIHSRCRDGRHREALSLAWEMERHAGGLLDLPAYRVLVKLCVALRDHERGVRYLARMKDAGFVPTGDMYGGLIGGYAAEGRMGRCRRLIREAELAGVKLERRLLSRLSEMGVEHSQL
ncbi:pentatricopeptide repeat-containing protein At2g01860 [Oryza glaberrima]|uniref:Pentacotripeptide-repeat region of PRORP domain-containing protein n=1 Tax=Oryza glaberrima TaxID=4538 RepID=I1NWL9_ORYGL|nr:pentatricopeptide repeat-containing protein At2g01860 [Oryza glaberrima]